MTQLLVNPKTGEEIKTELREEEALNILSKVSSDFAQSLVRQASNRRLSPIQWFWVFKIAEEQKNPKSITLDSNLQEFISKVPLLQFKVEEFGKIFLRTRYDCIAIFCGFRFCGKIIENQFLPTKKCPNIVKAEILLMAKGPIEWMQKWGKATGICCVCGRELTNEESVSLGIGPICREKF